MDNGTLIARAETLTELHARHRPLVLPTVWDAWSAKTAVEAGFSALTIGSHPLADSRGAADHEGQTFAEVIEAIRPIIAAVDVPVSVDLEAGYGQSASPTRTASGTASPGTTAPLSRRPPPLSSLQPDVKWGSSLLSTVLRAAPMAMCMSRYLYVPSRPPGRTRLI